MMARCETCGRSLLRARTTSERELDLVAIDPADAEEWRGIPRHPILAGRYWLHHVDENLPRARMLGPASPAEDLDRPRYRPHDAMCRAGKVEQLTLWEEREVLFAVDLRPGDVVLNWWPGMRRWERCEVVRLAPVEDALPCGRGLTMRNEYGELTEYLGNFEERLGEGNRLLPLVGAGAPEWALAAMPRRYRREVA